MVSLGVLSQEMRDTHHMPMILGYTFTYSAIWAIIYEALIDFYDSNVAPFPIGQQ